jgi:SAM-dependent methyltransferase
MAYRWARFAARSARQGYWDFVGNALRAECRLAGLSAADALRRGDGVECNICGWTGRRFYPNCGPGYDEVDTACPGCRAISRHRSLVAVLTHGTDIFAPGKRVIEVAPNRGFQALCLANGVDYTSFDLERYAMEKGDLTQMRYPTGVADYFVCFHVLEHVPQETLALREIRRVLKPGGCAVLQVPVRWDVERSYEYESPDPREVGHVRCYGRDFGPRIAAHGFDVTPVRAEECLPADERRRLALSDEPIFLARKPVAQAQSAARPSPARGRRQALSEK